jgi:hypothetical protein
MSAFNLLSPSQSSMVEGAYDITPRCSKLLLLKLSNKDQFKAANRQNKKVVLHYSIKCVRNKFFNFAPMKQVCRFDLSSFIKFQRRIFEELILKFCYQKSL